MISLYCSNEETFHVEQSLVNAWCRQFPDLDVQASLTRLSAWSEKNRRVDKDFAERWILSRLREDDAKHRRLLTGAKAAGDKSIAELRALFANDEPVTAKPFVYADHFENHDGWKPDPNNPNDMCPGCGLTAHAFFTDPYRGVPRRIPDESDQSREVQDASIPAGSTGSA